MAKRRTRKQKAQAKHQFKISWEPSPKTNRLEPEKGVSKANVKGQFRNTKTQGGNENAEKELTRVSAENKNLGTVKHDLFKSLLLASFIFGLEMVLYLFWR